MPSLKADKQAARIFISLAVPEEIKKAIQSNTAVLSSLRQIRWQPPEKFHITLRFLGQVRRQRLAGIRSVLRTCCKGIAPLNITTDGIASLGHRHPPLVVMVTGEAPLYKLKKAIDSKLKAIGFATEKKDFLPHITIGRVKKMMKLPELPQLKLDFKVDRVCLMESVLRAEGSQYTEIEGFGLGETA